MQEDKLQILLDVPQSLTYAHTSHKGHLNKAKRLSDADIESYVRELQDSNVQTSTQVLVEFLSELTNAVSYMEVPIQFSIIGIPSREGLLVTHPEFSYPIEVKLSHTCQTVIYNLGEILDIEVKPNLRANAMYHIIQAIEKLYTSCSANNETPVQVIQKGCLEYITGSPCHSQSNSIETPSWC